MSNDRQIGRTTGGYSSIYLVCSLFFITAIAGVFVLVATDILHHYKYTTFHQRLDSWPLIAIGLSYIALQCASKDALLDKIKGGILGLAFLLWGGEQLLPVSPLMTFMDEGAVAIFVLDIAWIVWGRLKQTSPADSN